MNLNTPRTRRLVFSLLAGSCSRSHEEDTWRIRYITATLESGWWKQNNFPLLSETFLTLIVDPVKESVGQQQIRYTSSSSFVISWSSCRCHQKRTSLHVTLPRKGDAVPHFLPPRLVSSLLSSLLILRVILNLWIFTYDWMCSGAPPPDEFILLRNVLFKVGGESEKTKIHNEAVFLVFELLNFRTEV